MSLSMTSHTALNLILIFENLFYVSKIFFNLLKYSQEILFNYSAHI